MYIRENVNADLGITVCMTDHQTQTVCKDKLFVKNTTCTHAEKITLK